MRTQAKKSDLHNMRIYDIRIDREEYLVKNYILLLMTSLAIWGLYLISPPIVLAAVGCQWQH